MKSVIFWLLASSATLFADGWTDLRRSCFTRSSILRPNYWLAECVQELLTTDPLSLTLGTVAPGAGILAYGAKVSHPVYLGQTEILPGGSFVRSTDGSFLLRDSVTVALPPLVARGLRSGAARMGTYRRVLATDAREVDAKASLTLAASRMEAKEQDFYGLGNNTAISARSGYNLRLNDASISWNNPVFSWSSAGLNADFLQPRTGLSANSAIPQVRDQFSENTAPGLSAYTDFASFQPYIAIQLPAHRTTYIALNVGYSFYHSIDDASRYSFRRLSADARLVHPLTFRAKRRGLFLPVIPPKREVNLAPQSPGRWLREAVCWNQRGADYCSIGDLSVFARVDYSFTKRNSVVPFYFQNTLGGTDFQGADTLRGYGDYRFRAPNRMYGQLEYRHPLWGPIGLLGFYDVGKVSNDRSGLAISNLHHNWGVGLYARIGGREVARIYLSFGSPEPARLHPKMGNLY